MDVRFLIVALAVPAALSACAGSGTVEPAELRQEDADFKRKQCVYPAIWHDNSQMCWEGSRKGEG